MIGAWLLASAWGTLAALPLVQRARRRTSTARVRELRPPDPGPGTGRPPPVATLLGRAVPGVVRRVVGGVSERRRMQRADAAVAAEVPVTVDLLGVAVGAGCTPQLAIEVAARWAPPVIGAHLQAVTRACSLGWSLASALDDVVVAVPRLHPLADALLASERLGAPVAPALGRLAAEERASLRRRAEARARTVPVRLLFPLVFLVLPAFGLLTVVPTLMGGLGRT